MPGITLHMSALILVLARRYRWALAAVVVTSVVGTTCVVAAVYGAMTVDGVAQIVWAVAVGIVYVAVTRLMMTADRYDREQQRTAHALEVDSWHSRRGREEARIDALVHDQIIALLTSIRPGPVHPEAQAYARGVLDTIDSWHDLSAALLSQGAGTVGAEPQTARIVGIDNINAQWQRFTV